MAARHQGVELAGGKLSVSLMTIPLFQKLG